MLGLLKRGVLSQPISVAKLAASCSPSPSSPMIAKLIPHSNGGLMLSSTLTSFCARTGCKKMGGMSSFNTTVSRTFITLPSNISLSITPFINKFILNASKGFGNFDPKKMGSEAGKNVEKNAKKWGNGGGDGPGGPIKGGPNYTSLVLLTMLAMGLSYMLTTSISDIKETTTTWRQFEQYLLHSGEIERIECRTGIARIFLRKPIAIPLDINSTNAGALLSSSAFPPPTTTTTADAITAATLTNQGIVSDKESTPLTEPPVSSISSSTTETVPDSSVDASIIPATTDAAGLPVPFAPLGANVYFMKIGPIESFERKIEALQMQSGVLPRDLIPIELVKEESTGLMSGILVSVFQIVVFVGILVLAQRWMANKMGGGGNGMGGIMGMGNNTNKRFKKENVKTRFTDVAGCDQAKMEIKEFVEFLQNSDKFKKLGAKIPRGALLTGPPGTGKTLLAKATAGEAGVPFYSAAGSDFVELYVGMGAKRARELFEEARKNAPCIIFIDEIDAIGKQRSRSGTGANDERDQTLNALLVEMDGFDSNSEVVVLAGTNRADMLDAALTRPGRFDRKISVEKPDLNGRKAIFEIHLPKFTINGEVSSFAARLAGLTPGFTGADIATLCNEAAIVAARASKDFIDMTDFEKAVDRVIAGAESTKIMSPEEKKIVAFHEAGHAVAGWFLQHADPLMKVTIIPRNSGALGFAQYLPKELYLMSEEQILDRVCMALAGRASEEVNFGKVTTGASDDLKRVTQIIYDMISVYGMNPRLGNVSYPRDGEEKRYSEATAELIDEEAQRMVVVAYDRTLKLIRERGVEVIKVAELLMTKETITNLDVSTAIGPRPFEMSKEYAQFVESGWSNPAPKKATPEVSAVDSSSSSSSSSDNSSSSSSSNSSSSSSSNNNNNENSSSSSGSSNTGKDK